MNQFQRLAVLVVRLGGFAIFSVGLMGLLYAAVVLVRSGSLAGLPEERLWVASTWFLAGLVLIALGRRIGVWLGRGLE